MQLRASCRRALRAGVLSFLALLALHGQAQEPERAPFFTTPEEVTREMLRFAGVASSDTVVDLGSGDGRIVIAAARDFGARGHGIEIDQALVSISRERAEQAGVAARATFAQGDVLRADFSQATVVTIYLLPSLIDRLQPRLLEELAPGTRIVSHAFAMKGWMPDRSHAVRLARAHEGQGDTSTLHLWIVPASVRGEWRTEGHEGPQWRLTLHQNFQAMEGEGTVGGKPIATRNGRVQGRSVQWDAEGLRFEGIVEGDRILGTLNDGRERRPLRLVRTR